MSVFVGRESELTVLGDVFERAIDGEGQFVLVSGEAGIGKTALIGQLNNRADDSEALVLTGAAFDLTTTPAYDPWLELVRHYRPEGELPPLPDFVTDRGALAALQSPEALHEAVLVFFADIARHRSLVLILEDLHWSDQASLDLLRFVARNLQGHRILLIATYRDDEVTRQHPLYQLLPALIRESDAERIHLRPIDEGAIQELVGHQFGLYGTDADVLVRHLMRWVEGNPLFAVETLRSMELEGITAHDAWMDWSGAVLGRSEGLLLWGRIHLAEGDSETALNHAFRARDRARDPEQPIALIAANRFLGE